MAKIRVGLIGVGFGNQVQLPAFQAHPDFEVIAICARRLERVQEAARRYTIPYTYTKYQELLANPEVDLVSVATPPADHFEMCQAAFAAGKHVFCEIAFVRNLDEAEQLDRLVKESGKIGMLDFELRFQPARRYIGDLLHQDYLGTPYLARADFLTGFLADPYGFPYRWLFQKDAGGGMLSGFGAHYIDALRTWFGPVREVTAFMQTVHKERFSPIENKMLRATADDTSVVLLQFANEVAGMVTASGITKHGKGRIELYGSAGTLLLDGVMGDLYGARNGQKELEKLDLPESYRIAIPGQQGLVMALLDVLSEAISSGQALAPSFTDGLEVQRILDAAEQSARKGERVALAPL